MAVSREQVSRLVRASVRGRDERLEAAEFCQVFECVPEGVLRLDDGVPVLKSKCARCGMYIAVLDV